ncbi:hypothetical protein FJZ26_00580 [Candidatus Parvarchaeota archaeon]|nr:hypothetical protein [Candidatus Parvarchaeota archaeon]
MQIAAKGNGTGCGGSGNGANNVIFLMQFGPHRTAADFEKTAKLINEFKPHLYSPEAAYTTKQIRASGGFMRMAADMKKARHNPGLKKAILGQLSRNADQRTVQFNLAETEFLIDNGLSMFPLEAHERPFHKDSMAKYVTMKNNAVQALYNKSLEEAAKLQLKAEFIFAQSFLERHRGIIANISTYQEDAKSIAPKIGGQETLRVLVRFGTMHKGIYQKALSHYSGIPQIQIKLDASANAESHSPPETMQKIIMAGLGARQNIDDKLRLDLPFRSLLYDLMHSFNNMVAPGQSAQEKQAFAYAMLEQVKKIISMMPLEKIKSVFIAAGGRTSGQSIAQWLEGINMQVWDWVGKNIKAEN